MFHQRSKIVMVLSLLVLCFLVGFGSMPANALPNFSFPWPVDLNGRIQWTGGIHAYGNLDDTALVPINVGSGLDFAGVPGDENFQVLSMAGGTVEFIGDGAFGNQVAVKHQIGGSIVIYGHLQSFSPAITEGSFVYRGQPLGYAGNSETNATHLHIELRDGSDSCCSLGHNGGAPLGWHGRSIDGWIFFEYRNNSELAATLAYNYDGVAIKDNPNVFWGETSGGFYTDAGMSQVTYLYTWLPVGYECVNPGPCDRVSTNPNLVGFSNHGVLGGGARLTSSNEVVEGQNPTPTPVPGPTNTPVPQYGDSHVDIREDTNFASGQYGWDNPTNGWVNVPEYMNDRTSSIAIDSGYSIKVAKDQNGGGATKCLVTSYSDLSGAYYDQGDPMTDTISSVWVYSDSTCGGTYIGTVPGDTVTVWVDPNYWGTHYGWHDPFAGNVAGYVSNGITAIAVTPGWSAVVYEGGNLSGGFACFTGSDPDLTNNFLNNQQPVNDTVESIEVFHDSVCGGRMHAPTVSLVSTVTNVSIKEVTNHLVWSGAVSTWQHFDFGDGATYDVSGASGDVSPTHQYANYGTYTVTVTVYGTDGIGYPYTQQVTIPAPQPPTVSLSVMHGSGSDFNYVEVDADWSGAAEDWQIVTFGDGSEVGYFGSSGTSVGHPNGNVHWYACCGDYTIAFNVRGADGQLYTDTEVVSVQLPSSPSVTLSAVVTNPTTGLVETNVTWSGASENWQVLNWGDGTETGYFGGSGTNVGHPNGHTHIYLPGSYTLTFTVLDFFGQPHTLTQNVTINAPTAPTLSVAFTQGTGETFNYVEVQATWSGAAEDWQVVDFGDGSSVGYFGGNGTSVGHPHGNSHWYAVGNYTITFTVKGLDGQSYTATVPVSITAP